MENYETYKYSKIGLRLNVGVHPVTVGMYREYCLAANVKMPLTPEFGWKTLHPIVNVSWHDAVSYCKWVQDTYQDDVRLPLLSEWTIASRGGLSPIIAHYPWGDEYIDECTWTSVKTKKSGTAPVIRTHNTFLNGYGLLDVSGNVSEWLYDSKPDTFNKRYTTGSWYSRERTAGHCDSCNDQSANYKSNFLGFRLVTIDR